MERKHFIRALLLSSVMPSLWLTACDSKQATKEASNRTFTCPMHPQIIQDHAGTCPICGMDLVPFNRDNKDRFLTLDQNQQALANISTMVIGDGTLNDYATVNGRFTVNPEATSFISSRNTGRIEQLYIKESGIPVQKGQAIYKLYSEQLLTLQQEYLMTYKQAQQFTDDVRFKDIFAAAKQKLLLYGQSPQQVDALLKSEKTSPYITVFAPNSGVVAEVLVVEGQYVSEGSSIIKLESYQTMWVEADIYPREAALVKEGQQLTVLPLGNTANPLPMKVQFITPSYQENAQILQLRGTVPNAENTLQAGMPATILLPRSTKAAALTLPSNAIVRTGKKNHVWVASDKDRFEPRMVELGAESADQTEITGGLKSGDTVVVSGAYLLYSEYVLKKGAL